MRGDQNGTPLVSVIVPAFNEAGTIGEVIRRVCAAPPLSKEIIVVDDGSTDGTGEASAEFGMRNAEFEDAGEGISDCRFRISGWEVPVLVLRHGTNRGKGAAIRTGLARARGELVIVQDADLEYDPQEYPRLIGPLLAGDADVVYGSRYLRRPPGERQFTTEAQRAQRRTRSGEPLFRWGVQMLNTLVGVLYDVRLTDEATCYKAFRTADLLRMDLECERFEFCPEVTAKACRMGLSIVEVPVSYVPRTVAEGKKIGWRDGVTAVRELWRWRKWTPVEATGLLTTERLLRETDKEPAAARR